MTYSIPGLESESSDTKFQSGEEGDECSALSDSLSRLRSPSVMEVKEKGYERLREELAKAQRVGGAHEFISQKEHLSKKLKMRVCARVCVCLCISI